MATDFANTFILDRRRARRLLGPDGGGAAVVDAEPASVAQSGAAGDSMSTAGAGIAPLLLDHEACPIDAKVGTPTEKPVRSLLEIKEGGLPEHMRRRSNLDIGPFNVRCVAVHRFGGSRCPYSSSLTRSLRAVSEYRADPSECVGLVQPVDSIHTRVQSSTRTSRRCSRRSPTGSSASQRAAQRSVCSSDGQRVHRSHSFRFTFTITPFANVVFLGKFGEQYQQTADGKTAVIQKCAWLLPVLRLIIVHLHVLIRISLFRRAPRV